MDWQPGQMSSDVEDRREDSGGGGFGFGGGGLGGGLGIVGFLILLVLSLVTGRNFLGAFFHGGGAQPGYVQPQQSPSRSPQTEDRDAHLISFVLDDVQKTWTGILQQKGRTYRHAKLVLFRDATYSGCGTAQSSTGPFYCPADEKVYIDLGFWDELKQFGGSTADFAQAYVVAHELGHHVQNLMGIEQKEQQTVRADPSQKNRLSVALELQADCFAGVWAHSAQQRGIVQTGDVDAALSAAAAVGDDHLQKMSGRAVSPESWTHGSSQQRETWFKRGLQSGNPSSCNTFAETSNE